MEPQNFRDKYEKSGRIGALLIRRFYAAVGLLIARLDPAPADAFEVGCGEGFSTRLLRELLPPACRFDASEFEPELAARARARNPGIEVSIQSAYALARAERGVDLLFCLEVLEHLEDPARALAELARVTRRAAVLSVPNEPLWRALNCARGKYLNALGNTPGHLNHWTPRGFERFVATRFRVLARAQPLPWTVVLVEPRR